MDQDKELREEYFLCGKQGKPELCEDMIVNGKYYCAVIDGVTSKSQKRYGGKTGGRYAAELVAEAIEALGERETAIGAFAALDQKIAAAYQQPQVASEDRIQACVILYSKFRREIWNYGDCQGMINERRLVHGKKIDDVLAGLRAYLIALHLKQGGKAEDIYAHDLGREAILPFMKDQALFANTAGEFGYPVLDGTGICPKYIKKYRVKPGDHVVLASDGYPRLFQTLAESEAYLQHVLEIDPLAIGENMQTKMCAPGNLSFDDRSYLSFFAK